MKKNKPFHVINAALIIIAIIAASVAMFTLERPTISETERRSLAVMPSFSFTKLFSGEYTRELSDYFSDTVPYRDELKKAAADIRSSFGVSMGKDDVEIFGDVQVVTSPPYEPATAPPAQPADNQNNQSGAEAPITTAPPQTTEPEQTSPPPKKGNNEVADGIVTNGQVVYFDEIRGGWAAMSYYGGGSGKSYSEGLNLARSLLPDSVRIYSMPCPSSSEFYIPENYKQYNASQEDNINSLNAQLSPGITNINAVPTLLSHMYEPIYTRSDHHWQPLGAYYAAKLFVDTVGGLPFTNLDEYERHDIEGYVGSMYTFTESKKLLNDPETFTYYIAPNDFRTEYYDIDGSFQAKSIFFFKQPVSQSYSIFMGGDKKIAKVTTDVANGRKLAVFKDSYGNAEIPFLMTSFEEIHVIDIRYFQPNGVKYITDNGITDILFSMSTFSAFGENSRYIGKIFS